MKSARYFRQSMMVRAAVAVLGLAAFPAWGGNPPDMCEVTPCASGCATACSSQCGDPATNPNCSGEDRTTSPDSDSYDPCKQFCPGFGPIEDEECKPECGGDCSSEFEYCDNPPDPCTGGDCFPGPPGGGGPGPGPGGGPNPGPCGGGTCSLGGGAGGGNFGSGSIKFRFGVGLLPGGLRAPPLWVHRRTPHPTLSKPASLHISPRKREDRKAQYGYADLPGPELLRDRNDVIRQVLAPQVFVDIVTVSTYRYKLDFYNTASVDPTRRDDDGFYIPLGTPYVTWEVRNPDESPTSYNKLRITEKEGGTTTVAQYDYTYNTATSAWTLDVRDGAGQLLRSESKSRISEPVSRRTVETLIVTEGGNPTYVSTSQYRWYTDAFASGMRLYQKDAGPGPWQAMSSHRTYWVPQGSFTPPNEKLWKLKSIVKPDGSWLLRDYDFIGAGGNDGQHSHLTVEVKPWKDQWPPAESWTDISQFETTHPTTLYDYHVAESPNAPYPVLYPGMYDSAYVSVFNYPRRPRTVTEKVNGVVVRKTYHVYLDLGGGWEEAAIEERCADPSYGTEHAGNLRTVTEYYGSELYGNGFLPPRIKSITYPDGRKDSHTPERGWYSPGNPSTGDRGSFTATVPPEEPGKDIRTTIVHGSTAHPDGIPGETTIELIVENEVGQRLLREVYVNPGATSDLIEWTEWVYDDRGRLTDSFSSNHTHAETAWQDCCRSSSTIDETGTETVREHDVLGRLKKITKKGIDGVTQDIVTDYSRSSLAAGYVETATVSAGDLSLTSHVEYDTAGRVIKSVDQAGLVTTYEYATAPGGGKKVTVTRPGPRPGAATEITEYYRDGRVKSITGTAVVNKYFDYWVDAEGLRWTRTLLGSDNPAATPFRTETAVNRLDQVVKTIEYYDTTGADAVTTTYSYNSKGQLERKGTTTQAGRVVADTLYVYNEMGEMIRSGLDVGGTSGVLDLVSDDRIEETATDYVSDGGWWHRTINKVYTLSDGGLITTGTVKRKLTGLDTGVTQESVSLDARGNETTSKVIVDRSAKQVTRTVDHPDTPEEANETTIVRNGLVHSVKSRTGVTTTYSYDALGRQVGVTDPRMGLSQTSYNAAGQVVSTKDAAVPPNETLYEYYAGTHLNAGRLKILTDPAGKKQYFSYSARGEQVRTWGETTYPVEYVYDVFGRRTQIKTYRGGTGWDGAEWPSSPGDADVTTFGYGVANPGKWLVQKQYADNSSVYYTHAPDGRLLLRTWARGGGSLVTTYSYDPNTGDMTGTNYSDATPDVTFTYDRAGRTKTVADVVGTRTFAYNTNDLQLATETIVGGANGYSLTVTRNYEDEGAGTVAGRTAGFSIGADYGVTYHYDSATGRLNRITGTGLPTYGVTYNYTANSDLVRLTQFMAGPSGAAVTVTREYEAQRPLLTSVRNDKTAGMISRYAYQYDAVGRRTSVLTTGSVFGAGAYNLWQYNYRSELTSSKRYTGSQVPVPPNLPDPEVTAERRLYTYDTIGNRKDRTESTGGAALYYCANNLNQYVTTDELATCPAQPPPTESFTHDADGNLTQDGQYTYTWDCENRLTVVAPTTPATDDKKLELLYDYRGRRVRKLLYNYSGGWQLLSDRRFVWDDWNLVMFLDGQNSNAIVRKQVWGLDLSGLAGRGAGVSPAGGIHGAGGIGGLLAAVQTQGAYQGSYWYLYDGNGNVAQVLSAGSYSVVAHYEYDPYGNAIVATGTYAAANPIRFSTKQWDANIGLGYWGYRYYSPTTGRWLSRDPIEEEGGLNLYGYVRNRLPNRVDPSGERILPGDDGLPIKIKPPFRPTPPLPTPPPREPGRCNLRDGWCHDDHYADGQNPHHPGSNRCYRSYDPPGQQVCYDSLGGLIIGGPGAGTPDCVGPAQGEDPDGTCSWDYFAVIGHYICDVLGIAL